MEEERARSQLREILRLRAVMYGDFVLSSGARSRYYLDARLVTLSAEAAHLVGRVFLDALAASAIDAVAGLTVGADPIVSAIATVAGISGLSIDGIIVRKESKEHGAGGRMVGPWRRGMRVAVVDDTLTTGASALTAARAVAEEGGEVTGIYALIDRGQGAREAIKAEGFSFTALYSARELLTQ